MTFSAWIKARRKALGLTQAELALRLDVDKQSISNWECGRSTPPEVPDLDLPVATPMPPTAAPPPSTVPVSDPSAPPRGAHRSRHERRSGAWPTTVYVDPVPPRALATTVISSTGQLDASSTAGRRLSTDPAPRRARAKVK